MTEIRGHSKRWLLDDDATQPPTLPIAGLDPLVAKLLWRRGIRDAEAARKFFDPTLKDLHDPRLLCGAVKAAERLCDAIRQKQHIVIYGDYDVDGVTATAILYHTLRAADPEARITRYVPHRIDEGYGLNAEAIEQLCNDGAQLIISVDCGITAIEPAKVAKKKRVDLIITDHHEMLPEGELPDAYALVHPRLCNDDGQTYPFHDLCGAGVAYKLAWQFARTWCGSERVTDTLRQLLVELLSFAALGTIADIVPLVGENRVIATFGLRRIKHTPFRGLNALIDASRLRDETVDAYHVGFVLGPRLNACGRMGHARSAVRLLTDPEEAEAKEIAQLLSAENDKRRATERAIFEQAKQMVEELGYHKDDCRTIVLGHPDWHAGVVGIVCSRLVEAFGRPTVLLAISNGHAHGSARSIDGFNIHEAFTACASHLEKFGGHAMAAGLRLATDKIDAFRADMIQHAMAKITVDQLIPALRLDAETTLATLTPGVVDQITRLAPFGRENPSPVLLIRDAKITQATTMGANARHLALTVQQNGTHMRCVAWNCGELKPRLATGMTIDLAAEPKINEWQGRRNVELIVKNLRFE
jgi:single-stranded-DNA-specific exonuclease